MTFKNKQAIANAVEKALSSVELTTDDVQEVKFVQAPSNLATEQYKLLSVLDYDEMMVEINGDPDNKMIIGSLDILNDKTTHVKMCYCRDDDKLTFGSLLIPDRFNPFFAMPKADDIYTSLCLGKVVVLYDSYTYFTSTGERKSEGEYQISKHKQLKLDVAPSVAPVRRKSSTTMMSISNRLNNSRTLPHQSRQTTQPPASPRINILKYRLVRYI